jgi:hypothetical protein
VKTVYLKAIRTGVLTGLIVTCSYIVLCLLFNKANGGEYGGLDGCCYFFIASMIIYPAGGMIGVTYVRDGLTRKAEAARVAFVTVLSGAALAGIATALADDVITVIRGQPIDAVEAGFFIVFMPAMLLVAAIPGLFLAVQAGMFWYGRLAKK